MPVSEARQREIKRLAYEGGAELSEALARGEAAYAEHLHRLRGEITRFLQTCEDPEELDYFAENWTRDGREWPIHELVRNPYADAGTLLRLYWYSDPEYYYQHNTSPADLKDDTDRDVFTTLILIEEQLCASDYRTASVPFDPSDWVLNPDRHATLVRPIPERLFRPIPG